MYESFFEMEHTPFTRDIPVERLSAHMNETDAATVAHALRALSGYTGRDWL